MEKWTSKLYSISIKYTLIGYYSKSAYKLLNRITGNTIKSKDICFEEETGHTMNKEPVPVLSPNKLPPILRFNDPLVHTVPTSSIDEEDSQIWKQIAVVPRIYIKHVPNKAINIQANKYHYYHTNQGSGTTTNWMYKNIS